MRLTATNRRWLIKMKALHERKPTWGRILPKMVAISLAFCVFVVGYGILVAGDWGSPIVYYCLGLATFLPLLSLSIVRRLVSRWPITDAIIDWNRVDELLAGERRGE